MLLDGPFSCLLASFAFLGKNPWIDSSILQKGELSDMALPEIRLKTGDTAVDACHRLALETLEFNIKPFQDGLLETQVPAIMAGEYYNTPWTRDCAYNVWNAGAHLAPEAARNTLLSVLMKDEERGVRIGGQYWDAIAWVIGAWHYYSVTGDAELLNLAYTATANSLDYFEETEFDSETGLFMGPASYGDGVAAYPEPYDEAGGSSGILDYPKANPAIGKIKMKALSTNCLYYAAYRLACEMEDQLKQNTRTSEWTRKAKALRKAINKHLWMEDEGRYGYFLGNNNELITHMEGLGQSLAVVLAVAEERHADQLINAQYIAPYGIPCVWPLFPRFATPDGMSFGRHCGTIWPFIQGYWADAAARCGRLDLLDRELTALTKAVDRVHNFMEIFHPITGEPYGGLQIDNGVMRIWDSCPRQTWSATGYIRMLHQVLMGLKFAPDGIWVQPAVPDRFNNLTLENIRYRKARLHFQVSGAGTLVHTVRLDGKPLKKPFIPAGMEGEHQVKVEVRS